MIPIVYLGPSMPVAEAERILRADYRPPIQRGDLTEVRSGQTVIIIDGEFGQSLSVSPKEILGLMEGGSTVVGASSMGALRAAELHRFGMRGVGWVYEGYSSGRIIGDDEVALIFSPVDGRALTIPLVNVRYWLDQLVDQGLLPASERSKLLPRARRIFYADRTPDCLCAELEDHLGVTKLRRLLEPFGGEIPDVKLQDCRLALSHVAVIQARRGD